MITIKDCFSWLKVTTLKWITLVASCLVMATAGSLFTFSVFAQGLRKRFDLGSKEINLISAFGNTALYISFLAIGPLYDKFGHKFTMALAILTYGLGYLLMWLLFEGKFGASTPVSDTAALCFFYFLAGFGSTAAYMATIGVNIVNFKAKYTGLVSAVLLLCYGFSGTLYSQVYSIGFADNGSGVDNTSGYLLFLFISVTVINFVCTFLMFKVPADTGYKRMKETEDGQDASANRNSLKLAQVPPEDEDFDIPLVDQNQSPAKTYTQPEEPKIDDAENLEPKSMSPLQILCSSVFWLFALTYILQQGLTYVTNVSSIVVAIEGPSADPIRLARTGADHVTLISIAQSASRFLFALLADIIGDKLKLDRSFLLIVAELCLLLPMMILSIGTDSVDVGVNLLWLCSILVGFGWGAAGALFPPLTRDFFGNISFSYLE